VTVPWAPLAIPQPHEPIERDSMDTSQTDQLASLIATKHECLKQLVELGRAQLQLITDNDLQRLLRVLAVKQTLIGQLETVSTSLEPFRHDDPATRVWKTPQFREQSAAQLQECDEMFGRVSQQEQESEQQLRSRRDDIGERLRTANSAQNARSAYTTTPAQSTHGLDLASNE
jgi:hypothetical protein